MKTLLQLAGAIAILTVAACAIMLASHLARLLDSWAQVPNTVNALAADVEMELHGLTGAVEATASNVNQQATGMRADALAVVREFRTTADQRIGDALVRYDATLHLVDTRSAAVVDTAAGLRSDLAPVLQNAAAAVKDGQDSWDDSYYDVRGLLESTTVATTQAAETLEVIRAKAPAFTSDVDGIASDVHDATHNLDVRFFHPPPKTSKQKVRDALREFLPFLLFALKA